MRCLYREKKIYSGDYLEVEIFPVLKPPGSRGKKAKPTSDAQTLLNSNNAAKRLTRLLNTNFTADDIKCELTYASEHLPDSDAQAARDLQNYLRRIKRFLKKQGLPELKYITVTEKGTRSGRYHHHIVMSGGILPADVARIWGKGYVMKIQPLQFTETGVAGIAWYMAGNKRGEITEPLFYKRWNASRNLKKPTEPPGNDYRISRKRAREMAAGIFEREAFERLYPGYVFVDCTQYHIVINSEDNADDEYFDNGYYLCLRFYRKEAQFCKTKKPRGTT